MRTDSGSNNVMKLRVQHLVIYFTTGSCYSVQFYIELVCYIFSVLDKIKHCDLLGIVLFLDKMFNILMYCRSLTKCTSGV